MQSVLPVRNSISLVPPRQAEQHYSPCPVHYAKDWVKARKLSPTVAVGVGHSDRGVSLLNAVSISSIWMGLVLSFG
jgi:hypothetical protein